MYNEAKNKLSLNIICTMLNLSLDKKLVSDLTNEWVMEIYTIFRNLTN